MLASSAAAQGDPWAALRVFEGKWEGPVTGKPGKQFSSGEYRFELKGKFLSPRDKSSCQIERGPSLGPVLEVTVKSVKEAKARLQKKGCQIVEDEPDFPRCYVKDPNGLIYNLTE